ncbi:TPA: helix-turn-helix transcriptional regulator [Yersinia enterocolitica]|nr:helix-turn-helix transcriptional regulator [Yersinia enterocolitica]HDL6985371.1 helix-turn-helix transcriptional regulator [Yersinia enterocolitica]HDL7067912.1 helix-turn-helix transcriptional regulator [Yersinia enterocolitica]HDL7072304.1 helix-turn-helix transcriptional regulator [Yersinia enterocolitica]
MIKFTDHPISRFEIREKNLSLSISIMSNDIYFNLGVITVIKDILKDLKYSLKININHYQYSGNLLLLDVNYIKKSIERKMRNIKLTGLLIFSPCQKCIFHQDSLPSEKIINILYLFSNTPLGLLKKMIFSKLEEILFKKNTIKIRNKIFLINRKLDKKLSKQETIIIQYFRQGHSGRQIAKILNKSEKTVSSQKRSAMKKIGARTDCELLRRMPMG